MKKILIEDFEKHGFEVDVIEHCKDEEMLCKIMKNGFFFKLYFDGEHKYVRLLDDFNDTIFADEVTDFKDLLGRLAHEIKRASIAYKQRSILEKIVYDELMKEIEK